MHSSSILLLGIALLSSGAACASLRGGTRRQNAIIGRSYSNIQGSSCFRSIQGMTDAMFDLEKEYPNLVSIECEY
jgi:hypothetical protein